MKYLTLPIALIEKAGEFYTPHLIAHDDMVGEFVKLNSDMSDFGQIEFRDSNTHLTIHVVEITSSYEFYFHDV